MPIPLALCEWGVRHKADPAGRPAINRHIGCGEEVQLAVICEGGRVVINSEGVKVVSGRGALLVSEA